MPRNAPGAGKAGQIYQPPIQKHRKEVGEQLRKRSHKPLKKQYKSQANVKQVKENVRKIAWYIPVVILLFLFFVYLFYAFFTSF